MNKPLFLIGGCKGGVGKSMVSLALVDYLRELDEPVLLIETDTSNPDVWRMYADEEPSVIRQSLNMDEADGWIVLANYCDEHPDRVVVVNTAARNNLGVAEYGNTLNDALQELERRLVTLWVINCDRDSLELLENYLETMRNSSIHVIRNTFFGKPEQFALYHNLWRKKIEKRGGRSLDLPQLAPRVSGDLYSKRWSIARALQKAPPGSPPGTALPIGNRAELNRWRNEVTQMFDAVIPRELSTASESEQELAS
ncbi:MAG: ArsA-related P-loop ATPase [Candidatus Competibacteraceae bacterium]|jgi:hypothetical protein|nr:ArsA-related P-loop ATPase [Candidatus Competibacteraceae bacterium]